jgi:uncharacterized membrane protein YphA (DoxX/SURF4 family)
LKFFTDLGIPLPMFNASFVASLECLGGWLLLVGVGPRLIAIPPTAAMAVVCLAAHREGLSVMLGEADKFLGAPPFLFRLTRLVVLIVDLARFYGRR